MMKNPFFTFRFVSVFLSCVFVCVVQTVSAQKFVTQSGAGNMDGTSWSDAYDAAGFRAALRNASAGDEFWVADGTYKPDNVRDSSFRIPNGVKIYGGFSSTDTTWVSRNWKVNISSLSGDIGTSGVITDNCYHVVLLYGTDTSTVIDGFKIEQGRANGAGKGQNNGAGIYNDGSGSGRSSSVTVRNCYIVSNSSTNDGGGMMDNGSLDGNVASIVDNCVFQKNSAGNGGGLYSAGYNGSNTGTANTLATNCMFIENTCTSLGGGGHAHINRGTVRYINCTFYANKAGGGSGSAYYNYKGESNFINCIIHANPNTDLAKSTSNATLNVYNCLVDGGFTGGTAIVNASPRFLDSTNYIGNDGYWGTDDDGLQIMEGSPAINWGLNDSVPSPIIYDFAGKNRVIHATVDLGAYESAYECTAVGITTTQTTLCSGNMLTFKAHSAFSGANPTYLWKVNGKNTNVKDSIFNTNSLNNHDIVTCYITSSLACSYPNNPSSNGIQVTVQSAPKISISGNVCLGSTLTVTGANNANSISWMQGNTLLSQSFRKGTGMGTTVAGDSSGSSGSDSILLNGPNSVFVDAAGSIYISDALNHRVQRWDKGAGYGVTVAGDMNGNSGNDSSKLNTPGGIYVDNMGNIYIADGLNHRVQKWSAGASYGTTVAGNANGNPGNGSGDLYLPTSVFLDDSGYIYVSDYMNNRIQKWMEGATNGVRVAGDASGNSGVDSTLLNGPIGLWVDTARNIYIADSKNHRVQKWSYSQNYGNTVAGDVAGNSGSDSTKLNTPSGIYIDAGNNLFIADRFNHRVMKYMPGYHYGILVAGDASGNSGATSAYLNQVSGVCTDSVGDIYVADVGNNRVQKWSQQISGTTYTPAAVGTYYVSVNTTAGCASTSGNITINNTVTPTITISASQTTVCAGTAITYSAATTEGGNNPKFVWMKNGNVVGTNDSTYHDNSPSQSDSIYCILTSNTTCASPAQVSSNTTGITVNAVPVATLMANGTTTFCQGDSIALHATSGAAKYIWQLNNTTFATSTDSIIYVNASGDYSVIVSSGTCADTSKAVTINVLLAPTAVVSPGKNKSICQGDSVILQASLGSNYTYQWYDGSNTIINATDSVYIVKSTGSYSVKVSNGNCSTVSNTVVITVNPIPTATVTPNTNQSICQGDSLMLQANSGNNYTYQWYNNGNGIPFATNQNYTAKSAGNYSVNVTADGCSANSNAVSVTVNPLPVAPVITRVGSVLTSSTAATYQWFFNGTMINGATSQSYNTANQNGKYSVQVSDANGCKNTSAELNFVGIGTLPSLQSISLQPNPTQGWFTLNIPQSKVGVQVILYDMTGKGIVLTNRMGTHDYDMSEQPQGVYIIKVISGHDATFLKLVKE